MRISFSWQGRFSLLMGAFLFFAIPNVYAQSCDLVITLDIGQCVAASSTLPVNETISDPYDTADDITILLDGIEFPWSPIRIRDDEPVIFTCWVSPGNSHTIFTQSLDIPSCTETANFYVPPCTCSIDMTASVSGPCNSSQQVPVTVNVTPTNPVAAGFDLLLDGAIVPGSPFAYTASSTTTITIFVNGTGSNHVLLARDDINASCSDQVNVFTPLCLPPVCSMAVSAVVSGGCNSNNKVPVAVTVTPTNPGNSGFNLLLDGAIVTGSPFSYAAGSSTTVTILVNGNAAPHSILAQDGLTPACQATTNITTPNCVISCAMAVSAVVSGGCNGNNQVPVAVTVTPTSPGNSGFNLLLDGAIVTGSPFSYAAGSSTTVTILVNGNAAPHSILAQDGLTPACQATTNITTPNCVIPCAMAVSAVVSGGCNGNNQVPVAVTVTPTSPGNSGFNLLLDGAIVTGSPFSYAAGSSTTITILVNGNGATHSILVRDNVQTNCSDNINITTPNCIVPCSLQATALITGGCTANNQVPVALTVSSVGQSGAGFNVFIDGALVAGSPFIYSASSSTVVNILVNGNGTQHIIQIQDAVNLSCSDALTLPTPNCVLPCSMVAVATLSGTCNANNQLPVSLQLISNGNGNSGFNILLDGALYPGSPFMYNASSSTVVPLLINSLGGYNHTILVTDIATPSCSATTTIFTPSCVVPCVLDLTATVSGSCTANNQVPTQLLVTSSGSGSIGFNIFVDGALYPGGPYSYAASSATAVNILVGGNGGSHLIQVQDVQTPNCSVTSSIFTPNCTIPCSIVATASIASACNANNQVLVALQLSANGSSNNGFNIFVDGSLYAGSPFAYSASSSTAVNLLINGNGNSHLIQVQDAITLTCIAVANIITPDCILPCGLSSSAIVTGTCSSSSKVPVAFTVVSSGNGNSGFNVFLDGSLYPGSPFLYTAGSSTTVMLWVNGNGASHILQAQDAVIPSCSTTSSVATPNCVVPCSLSATAFVAGPCNANNKVPVLLTVTAAGTGNSGFNIFVDGSIYPGSPFLYAAGSSTSISILVNGNGASHIVQVQDALTPNCSATTTLITPNCIVPCSLQATSMVTGACTANNQVPVQVLISAIGAGNSGFNLLVDGGLYPGSPFSYAAGSSTSIDILVNGNGALHTIQVQDRNTPNCTTSTLVTTPNCAPNCALSAVATISGPCNSNNKVPVQFILQSSGTTGVGFNLLVDGALYAGSPFNYTAGSSTVVTLLVNGNGAQHTIQAIDTGTPNCSATSLVLTPNCSIPCVISNLEVKTDPQVHIINLLDYTFSPANLEILVGDTIRFIWVSTLLHSTTSDALSGPNAWDSGVVGQGSVYNLVLKNPGIFPYYCKTHGGPGGIGMTGIITVLDPCTGGTANVPVSFNAQAGSTNGYNVYISGTIVAGSPFPYQNPNGSNTFILSLPGTGAATALTIQDAVTPFCALTTVFTAPDCGIPCGIVATATQNVPCTTMGQVGYSLVVIPSNAGTAGFNIFLDGALFAGSHLHIVHRALHRSIYFYPAMALTIP